MCPIKRELTNNHALIPLEDVNLGRGSYFIGMIDFYEVTIQKH